jgi:1,4-alpha-glucan branching enzyme
MLDAMPEQAAIQALVEGRHGDPFAILGRHDTPDGAVVRVLLPGAHGVEVTDRDGAIIGVLRSVHPDGLFAGPVSPDVPYLLRIDWGGAVQETADAYSFGLLLGELDLHLLGEGRHRDMANCLGAHPMTIDGIAGVRFAVWAPNASRVSVVGSFNSWDGRRNPMRQRSGGIWELFVPQVPVGAIYKYEMLDQWGHRLPEKADPLARQSEPPPATGSIVADPTPFAWSDAGWEARRAVLQSGDKPMAVYEVHAPSWMRTEDGRSMGWGALAERLVPYAVGMGYTHLELLPVMTHPFGGSWGYQPLGQFAPMGAMGSPADFALFVDRCHEAGLGVILDWVPAHFPTDAHGLAQFDGTALYEHADPREGFHKDWNTLIYNHGRNEVRGFLIASALFWLQHYHIDGLRVDAVASMLYRDYSRKDGEWVPNQYGGRENLEAISFLRELSIAIKERHPGALLIAEESTAFPGVTQPAEEGGLGFSQKWNMGWMHDTLHYVEEQPIYRAYHHGEMTFGLVYAFSEKFVLPISHDEVVHGKGSLLGKMPGDDWQQFANMRAYLGFMWTQPGKKLLFMGCDIAQRREWNHDAQVNWELIDAPMHRGVQTLVRDLNRAYAALPALHRKDFAPDGFQWLVGDDAQQSVFAWLRLGEDGDAPVLVVCNFTPVPRHDYRIGVPHAGRWLEVLNSDAQVYGGSGLGNGGAVTAEMAPGHGHAHSLSLVLPPLATLILRPDMG